MPVLLRRLAPTLLVLAVLATPASAAQAPVSARIVGGTAATGPWPAQTVVNFTVGGSSYLCGGTLVSARWVLTAAHCATAADGGPLAAGAYSLRIGSASRTSGGELRSVTQVVRHAGYDDTTLANDLALLHLTTPSTKEPLRLVDAGETALWAAGVSATVIGWGRMASGSTSPTLMEAGVPMVGDPDCAGVWPGFSGDTMVCAGGGASDTCSGDSGGPLMVPRQGAFALAGVTSWGADPCAEPGRPGVYARVGEPALNAWIRGLVPAVRVGTSPSAARPGDPVTLTATASTPAAQTGTPALAWDLDDDGAYDDATGASAATTFAAAGEPVVRVRSTYPDGDRAVVREVVTVAAAPASEPDPTPADPTPDPTPGDTSGTTPLDDVTVIADDLTGGEERPAPPAAAAAKAPGSVAAPVAIRGATLRAKGLRVRFRCARACTVTGRLTLDARTARRHGLTKGRTAVTIGRATARRRSAGAGTLTVRLTSRAKRALRRAGALSVVLRAEVVAGGERRPATRTVAVRR